MAGISDDYKHLFFHSHLQNELPSFCRSASQSGSKCRGTECMQVSDGLCNGSSENVVSNCGMMEIEDSRSSPYACSFNTVDDDDGDDDDDEDLTPEVQQAYRIFHSFLTDKHKVLTAPFWCPIGPGERGGNAVSFNRIDGKFVNREYESITEFVADFRLMLENCYRFHGVDHWISKQAQKLEIILEQKLTLLSRTLREKTTLAVTSGGRFGTEDEKGPAGTSTRRRSVPRNLAAITVGGCESIMVQALRLEEQQRAKEEKRYLQRELEKKEAEEASAKEVEEWEQCLLSLAEPWPISTMWELPAIGHFLCLAQTTLNLPEIVFFELERCLLMPRCSSFLAKVMTSLLCQPHRRATLHRRPSLPYRRWEAELRQKVLGWYKEVGQAEDQVARAEQLGLCHQFFWTLGETSPLDSTAFHLLPFNQRVWLLKGLCDNVYETQKDVQNAVLGQPIHECRESILGYDSQENAYIHFPHFCGADLRIYRQSPCAALSFPLPPFHVKKLECEVDTRGASGISAVMPNYLEHIGVKEENEDSTSGDLEFLDELRDLISKTEDELDELESSKKRCGRWYLKRESVKELHITLIRLLNELLPWEPKLLKHGTESLGCLIRGQEIFTSLSESGPLTQGLKHRQNCDLDEGFSPSKRGKFVDDYVISEPQFEVACHNSSRANPLTTERAPAITAPVGTFQRHCKPIQALLAKSVGNKVTLMSHPQATAMAQALGLPNKIETLAVSPTKPTTSLQVVCNVSDGLSLVRKDCTPLKFSMQPVMDQKTEEKLMQQIIILPSNLLIQNEETRTQQPSITSTTVLSNTIGFTVPENKIPVQQVAPLKDTSIVKTPSPSVSPSLLKLTSCRASPSPKKTTEPHSMLNRSPTPILSSAHPNKCDGKQELKTMCIRDSQSILVTTRGGNTGVVKVQTSEQSGAGSLPSSPVFTMPPQFQAFLVSKTSAMATSTAQAQIATTTAKLLPIISSPNDKGNSLKSSPQSPLKRVGAVNPSLLVESTCGAVTFSTGSPIPVTSVLDSHAKTAQTLISVNSLLTAPSQSNVSSTVKSVQGIPHTTTFNSTLQSPLKRCQARSLGPEQSTFPKVFLVTPTTNNPASTANVTTAPAPSTVSGSRVLFMSQSSSACSTVTIPKGPITSVSSTAAATSLPVEGMKVRPNFVHATGSTTTGTLTKVQGINISGLTARIVDEKTVTSNSLVPLTDAATKVASVTVSSVLATSSSGLIFVQKSNPAATTCPSMSIKGPVKATGATDGKTVTFSTYGSGHMASSALLSAVDQKNMSSTVSISNILNTKSEQVIGSLAPNLASLSSGSLINKDSTLPGGLMNDKPWVTTSLTTASSPIKLPTSVPRVSHPLTLTTTAATHTSGTTSPAPQPGLTSVVRAPINPISSNTAVQEKVVINTNAPLAPGTQLLINNMKFVVPAQGLGPGSHVLFISSPAMRPAGPLGTSPLPLVPRGAGTSNLLSPTPVVQGPRMVAPVMQSHHTPVRLPVCTTSVPFHQPLTTARPPLSSTDSTAFAQITQLGMVMSPGQQSLTNIVRLPSSSAPEGKGHSVVPSHREPNCRKKEVVAVAAQSQRSSQNMATPALVQTGLVSAPSKPQLTSVLSPVISRTPPMLTMPPMSSTISRMHTLPVATVPPIGGTISSCQATPIATIPPSVNTVIMAGRGVQPGNMRMPVVITNTSQVQGKAPVQVPGAHTIHTPSKLLLSPDGAILNVVRCPALQNVPVMANTMTAQVVVPTCSGVTGPDMNTLDSQRMLTVNPERPNH
uniref:Bromo domain-containing protein n=1 Tax=Pygocentrus nattereri TaxID=42514 RepID=A0A3B4CAJ5_PYGNA